MSNPSSDPETGSLSEVDRLLVRVPRWALGIYIAVIVMPSTLVLLLIANGKLDGSYAPAWITILVVGVVLAMIFGFFYGRAQERARGRASR